MRYPAIMCVLALAMLPLQFAMADGDSDSKAIPPAWLAATQLKAGDSFETARSRLIKRGWKPVRMHANDHYEYDGAEKRLVERKYYEVDSCSVDSARCVLYYTKAGKCLRVDTIGEQVREMTVTRWVQECPGEPPGIAK